METRRRARIASIDTAHGPMWDAFTIAKHLGTKCSHSIPKQASATGSGMLSRLIRILKHRGLLNDPTEVMIGKENIYLGPRAAAEWVDQIVMVRDSTPKARSLQEYFIAHVSERVSPPAPSQDRLEDVGVVIVPAGTVTYARFGGDVWVHLTALNGVLGDTPLNVDLSAARDFEYLGEVSPWVALEVATILVMSAPPSIEQRVLSNVFSALNSGEMPTNTTNEQSEPVAAEESPTQNYSDVNDAPEPASHDAEEVRELSVHAYIKTVSADPTVRKVYSAIIRANDGIPRSEIRAKMPSRIRKDIDRIVTWLIDNNAAYASGTRIYPILEHNGIRAVV